MLTNMEGQCPIFKSPSSPISESLHGVLDRGDVPVDPYQFCAACGGDVSVLRFEELGICESCESASRRDSDLALDPACLDTEELFEETR